jgi:AcrR family transcriptional regulator
MGTDEQQVDGRSVRWEAHKRERRAAIIQAAIEATEEHPPGTDIHVQLIAKKAGIGRPVVYRHFVDRDDLDRAVQRRALDMLTGQIIGAVSEGGGLRDVIERSVLRYVQWAHDHRALHRFAMRELPGKIDNPVRNVIRGISEQFKPLLLEGATVLGIELDEDDAATVDLVAFGVVSQIVSAVRLWLARGEDRKPAPEALAYRLSQIIWYQLDGMASTRGGKLDPNLPIANLTTLLAATQN